MRRLSMATVLDARLDDWAFVCRVRHESDQGQRIPLFPVLIMRQHLVHLLVATLLPFVLIAGVNMLVDPYGIWNVIEIQGLNSEKSELAAHERIFKTVGLTRQLAKTVILGTSRSDIGLDPRHPALGTSGLNLAISSQPNHESRLFFDRAIDVMGSKTVVIGLDFFVANSLLIQPPDFVADNYEAGRSAALIASVSTLKDSLKTLINRKTNPGDTWTPEGLRNGWDKRVEKDLGHRKMMASSEMGYLNNHYLAPTACAFQFIATDSKPTPIDEIRAIFIRAHRDRITLKLLVSPSHARQWETLAAAGRWDQWEEWKHQLVKMNEEEAQRAGQPPFPLRDFSGYNSITTETVPPLGDIQTMMRWYFDSSHYTPAAGDLVLDRIFNYQSPDRTVPDDFGVLMTSQTIEAHLARIRADRERYRQTHPQDVAEIEAMAREVAQTKRCKTTPL